VPKTNKTQKSVTQFTALSHVADAYDSSNVRIFVPCLANIKRMT